MRRLVLATAISMAALGAGSHSAWASEPLAPGQAPVKYVRWSYPAQIPTGPIETGDSPPGAAGPGFLTLPFQGPHFVTSIFDHCNPDYRHDGIVCRWDGKVKVAGGMTDADTSGQDWLYYDGHDGIDYGLYYENVAASADGVVTFAGWDKPGSPKFGYGQNVYIDHGNGILTRYAHLSQIQVAVGQHVSRGQVIGISGNTGSSTGEHLHWGVYKKQGLVPIDPYGWSGDFPDPWPQDIGNLWLGGGPRFAPVPQPRVSITALPADIQDQMTVSWTSGAAGSIDIDVVDGVGVRSWLHSAGAGQAVFQGTPGHSYWFLATLHDPLGWADSAGSGTIVLRQAALLP